MGKRKLGIVLFLSLLMTIVYSQPTYLENQSEVIDIFAVAEEEILFIVQEISNKDIADTLFSVSKRGVKVFIIIEQKSLYQASSYVPSLSLLNGVFAASTIDEINHAKAVIDSEYVVQGTLLRRRSSVLDRERTFVISDEEYAIDQRNDFIDLWDQSQDFEFDVEMLLHMSF